MENSFDWSGFRAGAEERGGTNAGNLIKGLNMNASRTFDSEEREREERWRANLNEKPISI